MKKQFDDIKKLLSAGAFLALAKKINEGNTKAIEIALKLNRQLDSHLNLKVSKIDVREEVERKRKELEKLPQEELLEHINQLIKES